MGKISRTAQKRHHDAMKLWESKDKFDHEDTLYFYGHYQEGATQLNALAGAFFTPWELARDFSMHVQGNSIIDLCAGTGMLSYACTGNNREDKLVCVELNQEYATLGRKLVPWATWYHKDVTELNELAEEDKFDVAISNPPFGKIGGYDMFDLEVVRIASRVARTGVFILPQMSTPFRCSGRSGFEQETTPKLAKWMEKNNIKFEMNCGIDCNIYIDQWKGVKPIVEIVLCDFTQGN